jgi:anti-anti-sigma factor
MRHEVLATSTGTSVSVFRLQGSLDLTSAWRLQLQLRDTITRGIPHVVINLSQVKFIDSSGLTTLVVGLRDSHKASGSFRLAAIHPDAKPVFEITDLIKIFPIFDSEESAIHTPRKLEVAPEADKHSCNQR